MICGMVLAGMLACGEGVESVLPADSASLPLKTYSVSSYGAKGNGFADDAPSIEKAMLAAAAAGGGQVTFPCGEFAVKSLQGGAPGARSALYVQQARGVQLIGQGHCSHIFTSIPQKSLFEFAQSQQIVVTQMHLTALNAQYVETFGMDGGSAVRFTGVSYGSITAVEVDGASAAALYITAGTSHSSVTDNNIHDVYGAAIWEDDCGAASSQSCAPSLPPSYNTYSGNTVRDASFYTYTAISIDDGNGVANAVIENNSVSWTRLPALGSGQNGCIGVNNATNVSVLNNTCTMAPWDGIVVTTGVSGVDKNITVQGNTIDSAGRGPIGGNGITVYNGPKGEGIVDITLAYNSITNVAANGIQLNDSAMAGSITGGQVVHNTITLADLRIPGTTFGIDVEYGGVVVVTANVVQGDGRCISAGVNVNHSNGTTPGTSDNVVSNILGIPLQIQ
jgi:hypothetical protein